jgi:purine-cytosine permease-like protein
MILGAAVGTFASTVATGPQPFAAFLTKPEIISTWFVVPFLIASLVQVFAINSLDLYSSGVTLQAMGVPVRRWQAVVIDTVIACGLTFYAVFSSSFHNLLSDFADVVICWIGPWFAIFIVDWILRRYRYVPAELQDTTRTSLYWGSGGIFWPAIIAQAVGTVIAVLSISQSAIPYYGLIARALGSRSGGYPDFSIFFGIVAAGLVYFVLARAAVRRQADRQDALLAS